MAETKRKRYSSTRDPPTTARDQNSGALKNLNSLNHHNKYPNQNLQNGQENFSRDQDSPQKSAGHKAQGSPIVKDKQILEGLNANVLKSIAKNIHKTIEQDNHKYNVDLSKFAKGFIRKDSQNSRELEDCMDKITRTTEQNEEFDYILQMKELTEGQGIDLGAIMANNPGFYAPQAGDCLTDKNGYGSCPKKGVNSGGGALTYRSGLQKGTGVGRSPYGTNVGKGINNHSRCSKSEIYTDCERPKGLGDSDREILKDDSSVDSA
jgi:hypothetical protein